MFLGIHCFFHFSSHNFVIHKIPHLNKKDLYYDECHNKSLALSLMQISLYRCNSIVGTVRTKSEITAQIYGGIWFTNTATWFLLSSSNMDSDKFIRLFFERFPVLFPRPVPIPVSYVSEAYALTGHARCIFKPGIILGRLFSFQGSWESIASPIQLEAILYTTTFENFF